MATVPDDGVEPAASAPEPAAPASAVTAPGPPAVPASGSPGGPLPASKADPGAAGLPLVAPIVQAGWSPDFVAQTLEVFLVCLGHDGLTNLRPMHGSSLRLPMGIGRDPSELVMGAIGRYDLTPIVVHSTSWRSEPGRVILTYIAAVAPPTSLSPFLAAEAIGRVDLARGGSTSAPAAIGVLQVLEHALRHLSWLVDEDPVVRDALGTWRPVLRAYVPEPFQNL